MTVAQKSRRHNRQSYEPSQRRTGPALVHFVRRLRLRHTWPNALARENSDPVRTLFARMVAETKGSLQRLDHELGTVVEARNRAAIALAELHHALTLLRQAAIRSRVALAWGNESAIPKDAVTEYLGIDDNDLARMMLPHHRTISDLEKNKCPLCHGVP